MKFRTCSLYESIFTSPLVPCNCGSKVPARCGTQRPPLLLAKYVYSLTTTRSALPLQAWKILSAESRNLPERPIPAPQSWSTSLRAARTCHPLTPSCLHFTRRVLRSRACPALPSSSTNWSGTLRKSSPPPLTRRSKPDGSSATQQPRAS
jgi:hypothetical protein